MPRDCHNAYSECSSCPGSGRKRGGNIGGFQRDRAAVQQAQTPQFDHLIPSVSPSAAAALAGAPTRAQQPSITDAAAVTQRLGGETAVPIEGIANVHRHAVLTPAVAKSAPSPPAVSSPCGGDARQRRPSAICRSGGRNASAASNLLPDCGFYRHRQLNITRRYRPCARWSRSQAAKIRHSPALLPMPFVWFRFYPIADPAISPSPN